MCNYCCPFQLSDSFYYLFRYSALWINTSKAEAHSASQLGLMHDREMITALQHTATKIVSLKRCIFFMGEKETGSCQWVQLGCSAVAQGNLGGFSWCRMMPTLTSHIPVPRPSYTQARENLVKAIPPKLLCLLACGGKDCRYEGPECWKLNQQVIRGLFSSWWDSVWLQPHTCCCVTCSFKVAAH